MPIYPSSYQPPLLFGSAHLQTIFPTLFRRLPAHNLQRERITTPDGDFLDLDWSVGNSKQLAILSHGLEGSSQRVYMLGMSRALRQAGIDTLCWNFRGCSGEMNRKLHFYHSGFTVDLQTVIRHAIEAGDYQEIYLIGFSIGGNITLKYLGEQGDELPSRIRGAVAFSVPCDLASSAVELAKPANKIYMRRFLKQLHLKIKAKIETFPGEIDDKDYHLIRDFRQFDDQYTAPLNGFRDAEDYWQQSSSKFYLKDIRCPALLVNALNDSFLSDDCYPVAEARNNPYLHLEMPAKGGHVGFVQFNRQNIYWLEKRALEFIRGVGEQQTETIMNQLNG